MSPDHVSGNPVSNVFYDVSKTIQLIAILKHSIGKKDEHAGEFTLVKSMVLTWFTLVSKGWYKTPKKISARIVFIR